MAQRWLASRAARTVHAPYARRPTAARDRRTAHAIATVNARRTSANFMCERRLIRGPLSPMKGAMTHAADFLSAPTSRAFEILATTPEEDIPLLAAALQIARDEYPSLDVAAIEAQAEGFATRAREAGAS